jgi:hypothetical protein
MLKYLLLLLLIANVVTWKSLRRADVCKFAREYNTSEFLNDPDLVD